FKEAYRAETGREVVVEWLNVGGTSEILRFIRSEFSTKPDGIDVDLMFGGGTDSCLELKRSGVTQTYRVPDSLMTGVAPSIGGVPMYDPDGHWYGTTLAGFGMMYNKVVLDLLGLPVPSAWEDLGDPRLFSWVGSADPRGSGSVHMMYEIILQAYGWEKGWEVITRMGGNVRNFVKGANQTIKDVATGEVAYGLAIDFYAMAMMNEAGEEKIGYVMPEGLTVVNPDAIAVLKGAPHLPVAEAFIRFVLSRSGQKLWLYKKGVPGGPVTYQLNRLSVTPALYTEHPEYNAVTINPFELRLGFRYDADLGSQRWRILNDLIGVMVIDTKDRLMTAWQEVIRGGGKEEEIRRLSKMPVTEGEALTYAKERWNNDTEFRNRTIAAWTAFAREKYRADGKVRDQLNQRFWVMIVGIGIGVVGLLYLWRVNRR
ncbi:MAG: ABC transporter substrate-binding protein, partial [Candidatus Latescibacteria bacterium]|nr:ABC transporter substrate-binding protein [Candidatus Latescibacterota bacterium]